MTSLFLPFAVAAVCTYFSLIRQFNLMAIGASIGWIALWATIKDHPPLDMVEGEAALVILMLGCIVMAVVVPLISLGRTITKARDQSGNFTVSSTSFNFPKLFKGSDDDDDDFPKKRGRSRDEALDDYRRQVRSALNNKSRRKR